MGVAGLDIGPGIDDRDHRLAGIIRRRIAYLLDARAMAEGTQILRAEPAMGTELFGFFARPAHV
jgi:hypothetical protein